MAQPRDTASKGLADRDPVGFVKMVLDLAGLSSQGNVTILDSDLKAASFTADRIFRIEEPKPWLLLVEVLGYRSPRIETRLDCYSAYGGYKYEIPVRTIIVLMSREADQPRLSGTYEQTLPDQDFPGGRPYRTFRYDVIRLWKIPVAQLLTVPITMLPFAVLGKCSKESFPEAVSQIGQRIEKEATPAEAAELWTYSRLLVGIRFSKEVIAAMFPDYSQLQDSVTFKEIVQIGVDKGRIEGRVEGREEGREEGIIEGRLTEALRLLLKQGRKRFGEPPGTFQKKLSEIRDPEIIDDLIDRMDDARSWQELLA